MDSIHIPGPASDRLRRRPALSCELCRRRKIKCNRGHPCSNCVRSNNATCTYREASPPVQGPRQIQKARSSVERPAKLPRGQRDPSQMEIDQASDLETPTIHAVPPASATAIANQSPRSNQSTISEVEGLRFRIKQLEEQLTKTPRESVGPVGLSPNYSISTTKSNLAGTFHIHSESAIAGQPPTISRSIMHKTRIFGQSHWMNGVAQFADILEILEPFLQNEGGDAMVNLTKSKQLGKKVKAQRTPAWPCPLTSDLPPPELVHVLVANYLRVTEGVYRVLHVPKFKQQYLAVLETNEPDASFLVLLKLVMAIGSTIYDDNFSMRANAIRWIHEAQTWISEPESKARLGIQFIQIHILLLLARELVGVEGSLVWISMGVLVRLAMYMGLNRDPEILPRMSTYQAEMRRRLWNTILELELHLSMESGSPPLCKLDEFNTMPPGNFDDEAINEENPIPASDDTYTDVSLSLALRKMYPLRLHIAKGLNGLSTHVGYEDTIRLDSDLRASYKSVCQHLQTPKAANDGKSPSDYETRLLDFFFRRYLTALHMPYFAASLKEAQYAYSRKVIVDTSLNIWCTVFPAASVMNSTTWDTDSAPEKRDDLSRMTLCGAGIVRTTATQAIFLIAAELKTQLQEDSSLGPMSFRRDLFSVLQDARGWGLHNIKAGETNIKGYLFLCLVCAQIECLLRGVSREELPHVLLKTAEEAEAAAISILESKIDANTESLETENQMMLNPVSELLGDWSLMMPGTHFYLGDPGSDMDWMTMDALAASTSYWD